MRRFDVAIIGGGPSGLCAAWSASRHGVDVAVFEEHKEIGVPRHCAGLVSGEGLELIGISNLGNCIENVVHRALIVLDDLCFELKKIGKPLYVLNREMFDKKLAERAIDEGAEVLLNAHVKSVEVKRDYATIKLSNGSCTCRMVIDAEGSKAKIVRDVGLEGPKHKIPALQVEVREADVDKDEVVVTVGSHWAPGFFAWLIPIDAHEARVGLASSTSYYCEKLLRRLMQRHPIISKALRKSHVKRTYGGTIVLGPSRRTSMRKFIVVGDAAGQTKPLTGGGVVYGSLCGIIAGIVVSRAVKRGVEVEGIYEAAWRRMLGKEEAYGLAIRESLGQGDISRLLKVSLKTSLIRDLESKVHYDYPITSLLRSPKLLFKALLSFMLINPTKAFKYSLRAIIS